MVEDIIKSYSDLSFHKKIGELIKKHSENTSDIREAVKGAIDWGNVHSILDLGCGYGWFEETLDGEFDLMIGIDYLDINEAEFLKIAGSIAKKAIFKKMRLPSPIGAQPDSFDLIVSAYSLYFFPETYRR